MRTIYFYRAARFMLVRRDKIFVGKGADNYSRVLDFTLVITCFNIVLGNLFSLVYGHLYIIRINYAPYKINNILISVSQ